MKKLLKNNLGIISIMVLAVTPLVLWYFMKPVSARFMSLGTAFRSLGQVTGLLGMALLSINFILSARFKFLDRLFSGLNRVYVKHHAVGVIAFCLLLFHPVFLTIQYLLISLKSSFIFIFSLRDLPVTTGKLALFVFMILMVITLYLNFKYQNWKNTHKYLGIVLLLGSLHMLYVPSDISRNTALKYYMLCLVALAMMSYLYRTIFAVYKKKEFKYALQEVVRVSDTIAELILAPLSQKMTFLPGQFIFIRFEHDGVLSESHPFSITSTPESGTVSLGVKTLGDYTSMAYLLKPGVVCWIEGPFGAFSYTKAESKRQIWIAGGIGITPFLGMARQLKTDDDYQIDLYYSVKNAGEAAFAKELAEIAQNNNNFRFHQHLSEKEGYISARLITESNEDIRAAEIFLCGPPVFMQSLRRQFVALGLRNDRIHSEEFSL